MTRANEYEYGELGREAVQERAMADALELLAAMLEAT